MASDRLPPLTDEEKQVLFQTRKEAIFKRVLPLMAVTNGFLYVRGRQTGTFQKASLVNKIVLFGSTSLISFFVGVASYGSEFKRRLEQLEHSPLRDAMNRKAGVAPAPGSPQMQTPPPFRRPYPSDQNLDLNRRSPASQFGDNYPIRTDSYNPNYSNYDDTRSFSGLDSNSSDRNQYSNNNEASPRLNQTDPNPPTTEGQKFMSYQERRQYYRNIPDARGNIDPSVNFPQRNQPPPSNQPTNQGIDSQNNLPAAEKPFIPFYQEDSGSSRNDSGRYF